MALHTALCLIGGVVLSTAPTMSSPVPTVETPGTHRAPPPPSGDTPLSVDTPLPTHVSRLGAAALEATARHEVGSEPTHEGQ